MRSTDCQCRKCVERQLVQDTCKLELKAENQRNTSNSSRQEETGTRTACTSGCCASQKKDTFASGENCTRDCYSDRRQGDYFTEQKQAAIERGDCCSGGDCQFSRSYNRGGSLAKPPCCSPGCICRCCTGSRPRPAYCSPGCRCSCCEGLEKNVTKERNDEDCNCEKCLRQRSLLTQKTNSPSGCSCKEGERTEKTQIRSREEQTTCECKNCVSEAARLITPKKSCSCCA